jgi:transcriptional regulator with XRE-family HTH domain
VENGVRNPTVSVLGRLAKALGVEADELLRSPAKTKGK